MDLWEALLQSGDQIEVVLERQVRVQAADNVKFRYSFRVSGSRRLKSFFQRHGVGTGSVFLASKSAETARRHADIRRVDVAIDVEVRHIAIHALAHLVGQPSHGENVRGAIQRGCIVQTQPFAGKDLFGYRLKTSVVSLKTVAGRAGNSCSLGVLNNNGSQRRIAKIARIASIAEIVRGKHFNPSNHGDFGNSWQFLLHLHLSLVLAVRSDVNNLT